MMASIMGVQASKEDATIYKTGVVTHDARDLAMVLGTKGIRATVLFAAIDSPVEGATSASEPVCTTTLRSSHQPSSIG